ncbi:hypothetical protein ACFL0X_03010 [Nanoarchaeota archaeon]
MKNKAKQIWMIVGIAAVVALVVAVVASMLSSSGVMFSPFSKFTKDKVVGFDRAVCTDSDGGWMSIWDRGTVTRGDRSKTDYCSESDEGYFLTEFYCSGSDIRSYEYDCLQRGDAVCVDGACMKIQDFLCEGTREEQIGLNYGCNLPPYWTPMSCGEVGVDYYLSHGYSDVELSCCFYESWGWDCYFKALDISPPEEDRNNFSIL